MSNIPVDCSQYCADEQRDHAPKNGEVHDARIPVLESFLLTNPLNEHGPYTGTNVVRSSL